MISNIEVHKQTGRGKKYEDFCGIRRFGDDSALVVLADGMGDTDCASEAAELVVNAILSRFDNQGTVADNLQNAVLAANDLIADISIKRRCKMGCAIAAAYLTSDVMMYVSLGNVRLYLSTKDERICVTKDDVYVATNGNEFLTQSVSGKDLDGKVDVKQCLLGGVTEVCFATDGAYNNNEYDDATEVVVPVIPSI